MTLLLLNIFYTNCKIYKNEKFVINTTFEHADVDLDNFDKRYETEKAFPDSTPKSSSSSFVLHNGKEIFYFDSDGDFDNFDSGSRDSLRSYIPKSMLKNHATLSAINDKIQKEFLTTAHDPVGMELGSKEMDPDYFSNKLSSDRKRDFSNHSSENTGSENRKIAEAFISSHDSEVS